MHKIARARSGLILPTGAAPIVAIPPPAKVNPKRWFTHCSINVRRIALFRRSPGSRYGAAQFEPTLVSHDATDPFQAEIDVS
jgi:hypothetical protein